MRAFCYASGLIGFGRRLPPGALPIARGAARALRAHITAHARHAYPPSVSLLVPGVPEANDQQAALAALDVFLARLAVRVPEGVRIIPSAAVVQHAQRAPERACAGVKAT
jgi:hypothetical protein